MSNKLKIKCVRAVYLPVLIFVLSIFALGCASTPDAKSPNENNPTPAPPAASAPPLPVNSKQSPPAAVAAAEGSASQTWEQRAIDGNIIISRFFDGVAEYVDLLLAGKRITRQRNETSVRIENSSVWKEGFGYTNSTAFNLNLRLPNVEEYWNLKFTSYDEEAEKRSTQNAQYRQRPRVENYGATIGFFQRLGNVRAAFQPRIELQNPLKVAHSLTLEQTHKIGEAGSFNPKVEFFAESDRGTGIFNQMNFGFQLNHVYSLSLINQQTYEDKTHNYLVAQGIAIGRPVTRTAAISYSLFFNSDNQTTYHLSSYSFATTWSQLLYRNILDYNVTPHIDFGKEVAFTGRTGIDFNINLKF
ncbi:hypothetical protein BH10BDE1_BH10BDE1_15990 [soil metagenome]